MATILPDQGLTFDDVLLQPGLAVAAREDIDVQMTLHDSLTLKLPIVSSPMDTVTEEHMAIAMAEAGGLGIIHRNMSAAEQAEKVRVVKMHTPASDVATKDGSGRLVVGAAVGVGADLDERIDALLGAQTDVLVVDSGHGHSSYIADAVKRIKQKKSDQLVFAGNVATAEGAKYLFDAGADVLRVGIGPGSICTTRVVAGVGVPQITAILNCAPVAEEYGKTIIADGGFKQMGDIAKAIACGAGAVMLGSLLAGHDQAPGDMVTIDGKNFKPYRGMGSVSAMQKGGAARYGQSSQTEAKKLIAEGVEGLVPSKGGVADFLYQAAGSLRSSCYYLGVQQLSDATKHATLVRMSPAGLKESHPHTISVVSAGGSYMA